MSESAPGTTLSTTEPAAPRKERTIKLPKGLNPESRRAKMADHLETKAEHFDKVDASIERAIEDRQDRISKSRSIKNFKPTEKNKKPDPADIIPTEAAGKTIEKPAAATEVAKVERGSDGKFVSKDKPNAEAAKEAETPKPDSASTVVEGTKDKTAAEPATEGLPDEHIRSLKAFGLTDDDITQGMKDGPAMFKLMAKQMHAARVKEITHFAEAGRAKQTTISAAVPQQTEQPVTRPTAAVQAPGIRPLIDIDKIEGQYGLKNDPLLRTILGQQNDLIAENNRLAQVQQQNAMAATAKNVDAFFAKSELAAYVEDYAKPGEREKVLRLATDILKGTAASGKQCSLDEALQMAHDSVAAPKAKAAARTEVIDEAKRRASAVTQKPSQSNSVPAGEVAKKPARNRAELLQRTAERLKKFQSA